MAELQNIWANIYKVDAEQRIVEGFASTEIPDAQGGMWMGQAYSGDLVGADALKAALPDFMEWANLREMHQDSAVGVVLKAEVIEGQVEVDGKTYNNPLHIVAKVVDDGAWEKIKEGVYKGFSIGGKVLEALIEKLGGRALRKIIKLALYEISLVDRPANPGARILLWKSEGSSLPSETSGEGNPAQTKIMQGASMEQADELKKAAAGDPMKVLASLQALRDEAELGGDLETATLYSSAIALMLQATGEAQETPEQEATEPAPEAEAESGMDESMPEAPEGIMAMAIRPTLRKAGRAFSGNNAQQMHGVIQALAKMLAASGDPVAAKVQECYGQPDAAPADAAPADAAQKEAECAPKQAAERSDDSLRKVEGLIQENDELKKSLAGLAQRLDLLERQPAPGGPVLRAAEKTIVGQEAPKAEEQEPAGPTIAELRKAAALEPDPYKRAVLNEQLIKAEAKTAKR